METSQDHHRTDNTALPTRNKKTSTSMQSVKDSPDKPSIDHFKLGKPLGEGNFSRIMVATHIATGEEFALKVIEKQHIKRLKVRHPNIFNEIQMEKEVLNKLRHRNIIRLYQTFQDESNLYFLLEYVQGGELLEQLLHESCQVGVHEDLARFYLADMVNAIEYMHANGVLHRDIKPENMVVCATDGHLRIIDFGTAKDLATTALNGPNFVGTPEYMPPETVDNKDATVACDIWALGCIAFQLLAGETPFGAGSTYLTLLKVQAATYVAPAFLSEAAKDLIQKCLQKGPDERASIAEIKVHPFFRGVDFANHMQAPRPTVQFQNVSLFELINELHGADKTRTSQQPLDFGRGDAVQLQINALSECDRSLLMHLLERKRLLHLPSIFPRFFATPSLGRCVQARTGEYVGLTHALQNQWSDTFTFMMVGGPRLGNLTVGSDEAREFRRRVVFPVNQRMPAFVVFCGDMVGVIPEHDAFPRQAHVVHELLNEIHPEVKLVFVPGVDTFGNSPSDTARACYAAQFGDDRFSFWHGGVKFIVINSSLIAAESDFPQQATDQEQWLANELENGKLCAKETVVLSAHSFHSLVQGPELPPHLEAHANQHGHESESALAPSKKKHYVELLAKHPPRLIVTTQGPADRVITVQTTRNPNASGDEEDEPAAVKKTEMVVCSSPMNTTNATAIHEAQVAQSSITVIQLTLAHQEDISAAKVTAPEDINVQLTSELEGKLEISPPVSTAN